MKKFSSVKAERPVNKMPDRPPHQKSQPPKRALSPRESTLPAPQLICRSSSPFACGDSPADLAAATNSRFQKDMCDELRRPTPFHRTLAEALLASPVRLLLEAAPLLYL